MNALDQYKELLSLSKLYLMREFEAKSWKVCDAEVFAYFKELATTKPAPQLEQKVAPTPAVAPPLPKKEEKVIEKKAPLPTPKPKIEKKKFTLESVAPPPAEDFTDLRQIFQEKFPSQRLLQEPPSDALAKTQEINWQDVPDVLILSLDPKPHSFLLNMANAISVECGHASVLPVGRIERENLWETYLNAKNLRLVIACDYGIYTLKHLMKFYREDSKRARHYLGKKPLLLLSDPSLYQKEPKLKPLLWKALCDII